MYKIENKRFVINTLRLNHHVFKSIQ